MGYKITYFGGDEKRSRSRAIPLTLLFLAIFLGWTFRNWEEGSSLILESLFSISAAEAREASGEMVERVGGGDGVVQAFTEFFQTVYSGGSEGPY